MKYSSTISSQINFMIGIICTIVAFILLISEGSEIGILATAWFGGFNLMILIAEFIGGAGKHNHCKKCRNQNGGEHAE